MPRMKENIKTMPYLLALNQIRTGEAVSGISPKTLDRIADQLKEWGFNIVLPIVCLSEVEDQYTLLTGLPVYEAAKLGNLQEMWVFLIAKPLNEAYSILEQLPSLSPLNETVIEPDDIKRFLKFVNDKKADLTAIAGIGQKTAEKIAAKRPYKDLADLQEKQGHKRPLKWIRAYK
jgi:hypothetical protein